MYFPGCDSILQRPESNNISFLYLSVWSYTIFTYVSLKNIIWIILKVTMEQHKINYRKYFAFYLSGDGSRMRVDDFNRDDGTRVCKGGAYTWSNWKFNNLFQVIAYNWRYGTLCFIAIRASLWLGADPGLAVPLRCGVVCLHATACRCVIYNLFLPLRPCTFFMIKAICSQQKL